MSILHGVWDMASIKPFGMLAKFSFPIKRGYSSQAKSESKLLCLYQFYFLFWGTYGLVAVCPFWAPILKRFTLYFIFNFRVLVYCDSFCHSKSPGAFWFLKGSFNLEDMVMTKFTYFHIIFFSITALIAANLVERP